MMNTTAKIFTLISLTFLGACNQVGEVPPCPDPASNSDAILFSTLWLQTAQEAELARKQAFSLAKAKLTINQLLFSGDERPKAVVLDLDETVLDNSPYEARLIKNGESFKPETWNTWVAEANADLIPGAKDFLMQTDKNGLEIFYISNRDQSGLRATLQNLKAHGLPNADSTHVLLKSESSDKTARRQQVEETHQIILLIGDQMGDFAEQAQLSEISEDSLHRHFVLIPNPMYGAFTKINDSLLEAENGNKLRAWKQKLILKEWEPLFSDAVMQR